jgi:hypothetical protein
LIEAGECLKVIAAKINRPNGGVFQKAKRLGLRVVVTRGYRTTTQKTLPKELPSVEEALKILAGLSRTYIRSQRFLVDLMLNGGEMITWLMKEEADSSEGRTTNT